MNDHVIEVSGLSKKYRIDHYGKNKQNTIWDMVRSTIKKPGSLVTGDRANHEAFWALKGIDFNVEKGDVLGIIGKNGSGKSTLLKILSQIVQPTTGTIKMNGRVASLLEVGTGFHPELTGRENIYFNGSILGMSRREINNKFQDIVDFSEIEKFLDTPVKFYSSGMYVRLAFAVAAHLEPDILIVDEVLAVGDAAFQKKSLGKMKDVAKQGRTVLFVSHSMQSVSQLCNKGLYLEGGNIKFRGSIDETIAAYSEQYNNTSGIIKNIKSQDYSQPIVINRAEIINNTGNISATVPLYEPWGTRLELKVAKTSKEVVVAFAVRNMFGNAVRTVWSKPQSYDEGTYSVFINFNDAFVEPGKYELIFGITSEDKLVQYIEDSGLQVSILDSSSILKTTTLKRTSGCGMILNQLTVEITKVA